jgi:hypothetical protein
MITLERAPMRTLLFFAGTALLIGCGGDDDGMTPGPCTSGEMCDAGPVCEMGICDRTCDGLVDAICLGDDRDGDGVEYCRPGGPATCDCDDCNPGVHPGLEEVACNGIDEDCSGSMTPCVAADQDADGFAGVSVGGNDCNDMDARTFPGAPENCDTREEESCGAHPLCRADDADGDGFAEPPSCENNAELVPMPDESCNRLDDDCDGLIDETLPDGRGCAAGTPIDLGTDHFNCGGCRVACGPEQRCVGGVCS